VAKENIRIKLLEVVLKNYFGGFAVLDFFNTLTSSEIKELRHSAPKIAEEIQNLANQQITWAEKLQAAEFARMVKDPYSRAVFMTLTDQVFRLSHDTAVLQKFIQILKQHGVPGFFGIFDQAMLQILKIFGPLIPNFLSPPIVWSILKVMRYKTRNVILNEEKENLQRYFLNCKKENLRININHLGDMVLGEKEAAKHLDDYIKGLRNPHVSCISVKISTLYSQTSNVAHDHTVFIVTEKLNKLLAIAHAEEKITNIPKLVYLDMEEYKDLALTVDVFKYFLQNPKSNHLTLGIALQAYIPDSFTYQQELTRRAKTRLARGGVPVRIRIVKGANMEMERCIASSNQWTQAPYSTKLETDANFKRMVSYAFNEENLKAVKIGIGSHNIFEIAFAKSLQSIRNLDPENFEYEMLEGIANHTRRSVQKLLGPVLIYSPLAGNEEFLNAIAYLVRRLMENTEAENFLSHSFNLTVGSAAWNEEKFKFLSALDHVQQLEIPSPRHKQSRGNKMSFNPVKPGSVENFIPDSPTNFSLPANQDWLENQIVISKSNEEPLILLKIAGKCISEERHLLPCKNIFQPDQGVAHFVAANSEDINQAILFLSKSEQTQWDIDGSFRQKTLQKVSIELQNHRAELICTAMKTIGKGVADLDAEVSEAIDFINYYPQAMTYFQKNYPHIVFEKKGLVLILSPWNFPIAIPAGGITAALATGNRVLIKPSPYSLLATWKLVKLFWKAGVPSSALQFIPCKDEDAPLLTQNPKIDQVIFTGSAGTADKILSKRPNLELSGETSGKNFFIVTDAADKELAIKQLIDSAFGYNGQKCSAASIAILTHDVYNDPKFKRQLKDAVESLPVGAHPSQLNNIITPLITHPKKELLRALTQLEPQEQWLVQPKEPQMKNLWGPAVKWNVQPGSFTHLTEFFGPVLGVMKAQDLKQACTLANQTEYGLTAGLQSLDDDEIQFFLENMKAGNLYVNNKTTGAIVGRQPFGGIKNSRRGAGGKAGGINYILQFTKFKDKGEPIQISELSSSPIGSLINFWEKIEWHNENAEYSNEIQRALKGATSCQHQYTNYFSKAQKLSETQQVIGQENIFRYRKVGKYTIRVHQEDSISDMLLRLIAGVIAGNNVSVSLPYSMCETKISRSLESHYLQLIRKSFSISFESDQELGNKILGNYMDRLAYTHSERVPTEIFKAAISVNLPIIHHKPVLEGRFLMLEQFNEQCISHTYHRYGNSGLKQFEGRNL
jgi:RHH-type transcriptional regulator, proline utilization regulon repressor / proline dehydrogenase / delta 1-pyrroline-5-carboxylate dehydrogenase